MAAYSNTVGSDGEWPPKLVLERPPHRFSFSVSPTSPPSQNKSFLFLFLLLVLVLYTAIPNLFDHVPFYSGEDCMRSTLGP